LTLVFHIDNVIVTYLLLQVVIEYTKKLDDRYSQYDPLMVARGKIYKYLEMMLDFRIKRSYTFY